MNNDERILALKELALKKREALGKPKKFVPVTNCSIEIDAARYNIQALPKEQLISLLVKLNAYRMAAQDLGIEDSYIISGFSIKDWITDAKAKLDIILYKENEAEVLALENKLHTLLSSDKKVELEIDAIEKLLK